jgi:hypothetical protein
MEWLIIPALCLLAALIATVIVLACWRQAVESDRDYFGE